MDKIKQLKQDIINQLYSAFINFFYEHKERLKVVFNEEVMKNLNTLECMRMYDDTWRIDYIFNTLSNKGIINISQILDLVYLWEDIADRTIVQNIVNYRKNSPFRCDYDLSKHQTMLAVSDVKRFMPLDEKYELDDVEGINLSCLNAWLKIALKY